MGRVRSKGWCRKEMHIKFWWGKLLETGRSEECKGFENNTLISVLVRKVLRLRDWLKEFCLIRVFVVYSFQFLISISEI